MEKSFIEMQLVYLIEIFEDNYKTVRDSFETDSVNLIKKEADCCKETQRKFQYIFTWLSHIRKPWKLSLGAITLKMFVSHTGL